MLAEVTSSGLNSVPAGAWALLTTVVGGIFGGIAWIIRRMMETEKDSRDLRDKVMDQMLPVITNGIETNKQVYKAMSEYATALAVQQARQDERRPDFPTRGR